LNGFNSWVDNDWDLNYRGSHNPPPFFDPNNPPNYSNPNPNYYGYNYDPGYQDPRQDKQLTQNTSLSGVQTPTAGTNLNAPNTEREGKQGNPNQGNQ
jgi:hypothetical protein